MAILTKASQQSAAKWNRQMILRLLQKHRVLSRSEIADMTELQGSTLTYIVRDMMARGTLRPAGKRDSGTVGPKQELIEINPRMGHVVGVDVRRGGVQVVARDMAGGLIDVFDMPVISRLVDLPDALADALSTRLAPQAAHAGPLLGVGVGVQGITDVARGMVLNSIRFEVQDLPLGEKLAQRLGTPTVIVDHNANCAALAEYREGATRECEDFVLFIINHEEDRSRPTFKSFGSALFLGGRIHRGVHFAAGELDGNLAPWPLFVAEPVELDYLCQPDAPLTDHLRELAGMVGRTIGSMVNFIDPAAVVVGGDMIIANTQFMQTIRDEMPRRVIPVRGRDIRVLPSTLGNQAVARGAALAAADAVLLSVAQPVAVGAS